MTLELGFVAAKPETFALDAKNNRVRGNKIAESSTYSIG